MKRTLLVAVLAAVGQLASAQTTTLGPLAFRLPASARMLGVADIGVIGRDDDVIFYNPAQLSVARGTSASAAWLSPDIRGGTMSTVLRLGNGGVGIGMNYLEYRSAFGVYPISRADILSAPSTFPAATSMLASIGYAQAIKGYRVGLSANYGADDIGQNRFRNAAADVGVAKDFGRLTTALALQHLGAPMKGSNTILVATDSVDLPMKATLGASWAGPAGPLDLVGVAAVSGLWHGHVSPAIGGEASWSWLSGFSVAWRAGVRYPTNVDDSKYTAGFGFTADRTTFDLGAEVMSNDKVGYRLGIRIR